MLAPLPLSASRTLPAAPAIVSRALTKAYDDRVAVDQLDLAVAPGTIACLLGPNGSGKSTTVGMLTTLRRPTSGTAAVGGHDVVRQPEAVRTVIGVALQRTGLDPAMSGREILELQGRLHGLGAAPARRRADELVALTGIGSHATTPVRTWSGGLRRRLDLAVALVHQPRVLFLDEPTTGLDPASRRAIWDEIRRLNVECGVTVLLTTQALDEADHLAEVISILRDGRLVVTATPQALKDDLGARSLTLVLRDAEQAARATEVLAAGWRPERTAPDTLRLPIGRDDAARCVALLARCDLDVTAMRTQEPSLEDVFLQLTGA